MHGSYRFPGTALVVCHPLASGHGGMAVDLHRLGLLERLVMFKIRRADAEAGFVEVVRARANPGGSAVLASFYLPSRWGRAVRRFRWTHLASPHFFHLARRAPNLTGVVHDLGHLDPRATSASPIGYRYLMTRELRYASHLRGVVTVSATTGELLRRVNPQVRPVTIHNWTGDEFRPRDRDESRRRLGLPLDRSLILSVGLDIPRKNTDLLPRLVRALGPGFAVVRVGDCRRLEPDFPPGTLIARSAVPAADYPLYFNAADLLVYPSRDEGFGRPLIEAVNSNTPLLASDIPVFREVLRGDRQLVPIDDFDRWVEAARVAAAIDPARRRTGSLYPELGDYYRPARALAEYTAFFRSAGLA